MFLKDNFTQNFKLSHCLLTPHADGMLDVLVHETFQELCRKAEVHHLPKVLKTWHEDGFI